MHECQEIWSANINQKEDHFLIYERDLLILATITTQFFFSGNSTTEIWILSFPIILGIPILASIICTKDDELNQLN
jgi:predicted membrane channel-forming protein YqfA (hemolysin III family)